jgi:hypothetical protein
VRFPSKEVENENEDDWGGYLFRANHIQLRELIQRDRIPRAQVSPESFQAQIGGFGPPGGFIMKNPG